MLYHETKDIIYVQRFLGHRSVQSTEKYINIELTLFDSVIADQKWIVRLSSDPKEITALLEDGFEARCNQRDLIYLRKRA